MRISTGIKAYWPVDCLGREGQCEIPLIRGDATADGPGRRWGWDGNDPPTIAPSYACQKCGLHITITKGIESGRPAAKS